MIDRFDGEYRWLSNFWPARVEMYGVEYPTVEHAYQAAKTLDPTQRAAIAKLPTPGQAKRAGRNVTMRADWNEIKLPTMRILVERKFLHEDLAAKLRATGDEQLIEGNYWNDTFWGVCRGRGENHLGKILMAVRDAL